MTLPEHVICSTVLAQFGMRQRYGWRGVTLMIFAGIAPDLDTSAKLLTDQAFWKLHHALGHNVWAVAGLSALGAGFGRLFGRMTPIGYVFLWGVASSTAHCLTDALYWWGIFPFWPVSDFELKFGLLEYLDLIVLTIWLVGLAALCKRRGSTAGTGAAILITFALYVAIRAALPEPTGMMKLIMGGWIYMPPQGTPVLDWW